MLLKAMRVLPPVPQTEKTALQIRSWELRTQRVFDAVVSLRTKSGHGRI